MVLPQASISRQSLFTAGEQQMLVLLLGCVVCYGVLVAACSSLAYIWMMGLRQVAAIIPFGVAITALLIAKASGASRVLGWALVALFCFTNVGRISIWTLLTDAPSQIDSPATLSLHAPKDWISKIFKTQLIEYVHTLIYPNPGSVERICRFLKVHAAPEDILITNYSWEPLYFHTRLPQGLKILPHYPIYARAKACGLPEYVFDVEGAKWVVCRWVWDRYQGYDLEGIGQMLISRGASIHLMASLPESIWENRENIHFFRYSKSRYVYPFFPQARDIAIYRVDWPSTHAESTAKVPPSLARGL